MSFTFHQPVNTPNGPGIVQGKSIKPGEPDRILVSHSTKTNPNYTHVRGIWVLKTYLPEEVTPSQDTNPEPIKNVLARVANKVNSRRS